MSERARQGVALGSGLAVVVVVAVALPSALLLRERFFLGAPPPPVAVVAAPVVIDVSAARAAVVDVEQRLVRAAAASVQLEERAREAERGDRLRVVGRAVAKARDVRRAQGQSGPQLRGPFPLRELGDVGALGFGADTRWLMTRDGRVLAPDDAAPAALTAEVGAWLVTTGRDEDPLVVDATIAGKPGRLLRRCVPAEAYCIVDVDGPMAAGAAIDLAPLRRSIEALATAAPPPAVQVAPTLVSPSSPWWVAAVVVVVSALLAVFAVGRVRNIADAIVAAALRLRAGLAGRAAIASAPLSAELNELDRAIDAAFAALGLHADNASGDDERRARMTAVADALDAARGLGGVERLPPVAADDAITARVVQSANGLLDALDERARRWKVLVADAGAAGTDVLPSLAQRLLRLARVPGLPQPMVDELTSLGTAVAGRVGSDDALQTLQTEVARVTPPGAGAAERFAIVAALRDLPPAEIARLTQSPTSLPAAESPPPPPRPNE